VLFGDHCADQPDWRITVGADPHGMQVRLALGDDTAYQQRRHGLREQFARWLLGRPMAADP
jgi:hypothetical protein